MHLFVSALFFHQCNMKTVRAAEDRGHFAHWGSIYCILKWIDKAEHFNPTEFTAVFFACWVLSHLACYIGERLWLAYGNPLATFLHFLLHASSNALACQFYLGCGSCYGSRVGVGWTLYSNVCCAAHIRFAVVAHGYQTVNGFLVLQVFWSGLRTITCQFLFECLGCIHTLSNGFGHFQLEVDKEVQVFFHRLLFQTVLLVVFLVDIQELRQHHGLTVDG